jgi:hypothetical protein
MGGQTAEVNESSGDTEKRVEILAPADYVCFAQPSSLTVRDAD